MPGGTPGSTTMAPERCIPRPKPSANAAPPPTKGGEGSGCESRGDKHRGAGVIPASIDDPRLLSLAPPGHKHRHRRVRAARTASGPCAL